MNKTKYNQLREEIIKAVPEIVELEFGCEVDVGYPKAHYVKVLRTLKSNKYSICNYIRNTKYEGIQEIIEYRDNFSIERTPIKEITKIIGRDITLEDCLIALEENTTEEKSIFITTDGEFYFLNNKIGVYSVTAVWWKRGKPLQDQSDETLTLLVDLLL